ncbi:hypothetical protein JTE90_007278 [Oedothorax gibbosus]|uniref:Uncharacterized protein n=1 Tax=Oedothorax gibbosus TaxID=931172 RepID=A0AAV6VLH1_9ARAC|nr:hypothetical protein JTE90_007278 [Oedothorax gibbosus]
MNPDKGKDETSGGKPAGGSPGGKAAGGAGTGGKDEKPSSGAPGAPGQDKKKEECAGPKGLQKIFDLYSKCGGPVSGGSGGLSKENFIKWMTAAKLIDEKTGCSEQDFGKAFDKAAEGEKSLDFCGFHELVENVCKEKQKEPKEFFDKLIAAGPPIEKDAKMAAF